MQVLRAEITSVCGEDWRDGTLSIAQLDRMVKLDSFIKESQRVATPTLCKFQAYLRLYMHFSISSSPRLNRHDGPPGHEASPAL